MVTVRFLDHRGAVCVEILVWSIATSWASLGRRFSGYQPLLCSISSVEFSTLVRRVARAWQKKDFWVIEVWLFSWVKSKNKLQISKSWKTQGKLPMLQILLFLFCPSGSPHQTGKRHSQIEATMGDVQPGPVDVRNCISQAIYQLSFETCTSTFCEENC